MDATHTYVALPRPYSAGPLELANSPGPHFLQGPPGPFLCPRPFPLLLLLPLLLLMSSGPKGAAERIQFWPRSQGCPAWWHSSKPSDASSSDGRPCGFAHTQSSVPPAGRPVPAGHLVPGAHSGLRACPGPAPPPSSLPAPWRTTVPASHLPQLPPLT